MKQIEVVAAIIYDDEALIKLAKSLEVRPEKCNFAADIRPEKCNLNNMKYLFIICLLFIVSCGQKPKEIKKDTFAENAERHLPMVIDVLYPQAPNSKPEIAERNTLYTDDSLHIASFVMKYQNALGITSRDTFEYIFGLHKDASYYYLLCPKRQRPLYSELMDLYNETKNQSRYQNLDSINKKSMLHGIAAFYCQANNGGKFKN